MNKQTIEKDYLNRKLNSILLKLRDAKISAEMTYAHFDAPSDPIVVTEKVDGTRINATKFIKDRTKLYRDVWITDPIQEIIEEVERLKKMT